MEGVRVSIKEFRNCLIFFTKNLTDALISCLRVNTFCILGLDFIFNRDMFRYQLVERDYGLMCCYA